MIPNKPHIFNALLLTFMLLSLNIFAQTQETLAVGQVLNATDKSPVPDANIYFKNTGKGTKSNDEGYFMIRTTGEETTLVFSAVGYRTKEIRLKKGQSTGMQVELKEQNVELYEVMVVPGANPALPLMRKVREARERNNYSRHISGSSTEQNLVYLGNISRNSLKRKIFSQLAEGSIETADSSLVMPLFMSEKKLQRQKNTVSVISEDFFSSKPENERLLLGLTNQQSAEINFYHNSLTLFNQSFVSPLASSGNAYYNFYLIDSIITGDKKEYQINFRTKNPKNLAFNGTMKIDSASLALTYIDATLPAGANLNYVHLLHIQQKFQPKAGFFVPESEQFSSNITYEMLADSLHPKPELFIYKKTITENINISEPANENFAGSNLSAFEIDNSMAQLGNTSVVRFAKWLADVIITGYIPVGKVDIGKVQHIARLTEVEGLRLTLPFRTNETFSKNIGFSGYAGYGFKNNIPKYSAGFHYKLPTENRLIFNANYTDDYRRVDYDYNDFLYRENPLLSGDEDIAITIFGLRTARKLNERKEFSTSLTYDWNKNIESTLFYRHHRLGDSDAMPFVQNTTALSQITQQSVVLQSRFSFGERVYDDHFQRIYVPNEKPVIYTILEAGKFNAGTKQGNYLKINASLKQQVRFTAGQWNYMFETGKIFGEVPYSLLEIPMGNGAFPYRRNLFNTLRDMEYAFDQYAGMHNELIMNGVVMNHIPLIKHLNLRELLTFKVLYGSRNNTHNNIMDIPANIYKLNQPHMEVGVGFSNILRLFTLQSVWRLTNLDHPGAERWSIRGSIRAGF